MRRVTNSPPPERCVFFAPHQDDITFGCGGTIALKRKAGIDTYVVCIADGRNSHVLSFGIKRNPSPSELVKIRENEEKQAMQDLGMESYKVLFLRVEDGLLYGHRQEAIRKVTDVLQRLKPAEVFIPYIGDKHPDHVATHLIVSTCLEQLGMQPSTYQYFVWSRPSHRMRGNLVVTDISGVLDLKKLAISRYESQVTTKYSPRQSKAVLRNEFLERFQSGTEEFLTGSLGSPSGIGRLWFFLQLSVSACGIAFLIQVRHWL